MSVPEGYKPVRCHYCDEQLYWVKQYVEPGMRMNSEDALNLDGSEVMPGSKFVHCPNGPHKGPPRFKLS